MPSAEHPLKFIAPVPRLTGDGETWVKQVKRLEELGFDTVAVSHHVTNGWQLAPIAAMAFAAASTTRLRVLSLVMQTPLQHPALLAKEIATIDRLSGGRVELGIGAGWLSEDYTALGLRLEPAGTRLAQFVEALSVIDEYFIKDTVDFVGEHYRLERLEALPRCVQKPNPPILIGASGPRMLEVAGRHADIVGLRAPTFDAGSDQPVVGDLSADSLAASIARVRRAAQAAGRATPRIQYSCAHVHVTDADEPPRHRSAIADIVEAQLDSLEDSPAVLVGTAQQCAAKIRRCRERFGIDYWHLGQDVDAASRIIEQLR